MFYRCVVHLIALVLAVLAAPGHRTSAQPLRPDAPPAAGPTAPAPAGSPARLDGTVLHTEEAVTLVFVEGRVVSVHPTLSVMLQPGDRVTVTGTAVTRGPDRDVVSATIVRHGSGALPQPRRVSVAELAADDGAGSWVEFEGVVREQIARPAHVELRIGGGLLGSIGIVVPSLDAPLRNRLIDAVVRIRAVRHVQRNAQGVLTGVRIVAPRLTASDIVEAADASVAELPVHPISRVRDIALRRLSERRLRMKGIVAVRVPGAPGKETLMVQDATGGLPIEVDLGRGIAVGDELDIAGFPSQFYGAPFLASSVATRLRTAASVEPIRATVSDIVTGRFAGQMVSLSGTYQQTSAGPNFRNVTMTSDGVPVIGYVYDWPAHGPLPELTKNAAVELTGIATAVRDEKGNPQSVMIVLRDPSGILYTPPSLWTVRNLALAALLAGSIGALALGWVAVLNARMRRKTRELAEQYERSAALQQRFMDLVTTASDAILTWDLDGRLLSLNRTGERLLGVTEAEARRKTVKDVVAPQSAAVADGLVPPADVTPAAQTYEIWVRGATGEDVPLEFSVQPMFEDRRHVGYQGIARDMSDRKRMEAALRAARDAAEDASRAKSEFLANISHEIRTPMNGILGMTELALGSDLAPAQREYLETVRMSAESLLGLLNGILDFSKIESRRLEIESVPFSLRDVMAETLKPLAMKADQKGLELLFESSPDAPDAVIGDPLRLRQIVTNLVSNAVKFTERGHVLVHVRHEQSDSERVTLHFVVSDTGVGIPLEKHALIFEPFSQADGSTTRKYGGTGLGLAISSTLVQLMGGRLWLESEQGLGSHFHFTLRLERAAAVEPSQVIPYLAGLPVLVVDDNAVNRRILAEQLRGFGMQPTLVGRGSEAIDRLVAAHGEGTPFRLVLLDAHMPELDGFQVAERIAVRPQLAGATIMMLTSGGKQGDTERCRALNVSAYLTKPIAPRYLLDAICRLLGPNVTAPPAAALVAPASVRSCHVLLAEDNIVNQKVAVGLLTKRGHQVTVVTNGQEAVDAVLREPFDVVLMDVQMPVLSGLEAAAAIRAREADTGGHIRIIAMTAHTMSGDREACLASGMDGYVSKPVKPQALYAAVEDGVMLEDAA